VKIVIALSVIACMTLSVRAVEPVPAGTTTQAIRHPQTPINLSINVAFDNVNKTIGTQEMSNTVSKHKLKYQASGDWLRKTLHLDDLKTQSEGVYGWCCDNKKKTVLLATIAVYSAVIVQLIRYNHIMHRPGAWSSWNSHMSLESLFAIPQKELSDELLREIQRRYMNAHNPTDFLTPLMRFVDDVDYELATLGSLQNMQEWIAFLHINWLFPERILRQTERENRAIRLAYIKTLFMNWIADYKILANTIKKHTYRSWITRLLELPQTMKYRLNQS
jgi:hypothetical protein